MSADNWAKCPRCWKKAREERDSLREQTMNMYGVLPIKEWEELRERAEAPIDLQASFREDYEIYGAEEGWVQISYRGCCTKCSLKLSFKDMREIEGWID